MSSAVNCPPAKIAGATGKFLAAPRIVSSSARPATAIAEAALSCVERKTTSGPRFQFIVVFCRRKVLRRVVQRGERYWIADRGHAQPTPFASVNVSQRTSSLFPFSCGRT